mmetsp:Transcript_36193/g.64409  ORF Transcript_36193/g.64409 Transcript_36193/m.64409 type:complete len:477 (-) Transcript_36193:148-1578(-)
MAMLRRLEGRACCTSKARPWTSVPCARSRASDWSAQSLHLDADRRVEAKLHQRLAREAREVAETQRLAERGLQLDAGRARRAHAADMEAALERQLEHWQSEKARFAAQVHQVSHSNPELHALQHRCKVERASQQRALQLLEAEVAEEEARQRTVAELESSMFARLRNEETWRAREAARRADGKELLHDLSTQAALSRESHTMQLDAERRESRSLVDRAAARAREEDLHGLSSRRRAQAKLHRALDVQVAERAQQHSEQLAADLQHAQRDKEHLDEKQALAEALAAERQQAEDSRRRLLSGLARALHAEHLETRLLEELREAVALEEREVQQRQADELRLRRALQSRMEAANACKESLKSLEQRRLMAAEEEQLERQDLLRKFEEDEKLEQLGEQRRRAKLLAHRREVDRMLGEQRVAKEREQQRKHEEMRARQVEEERAARIIKEERQRLLDAYGLVVQSTRLASLLSGVCRPVAA